MVKPSLQCSLVGSGNASFWKVPVHSSVTYVSTRFEYPASFAGIESNLKAIQSLLVFSILIIDDAKVIQVGGIKDRSTFWDMLAEDGNALP